MIFLRISKSLTAQRFLAAANLPCAS